MLLRLAYLTVTNAFAVLRLLPMSDRDKDAEILALRHQITVLERQLRGEKARFSPSDRAFLPAQQFGRAPEAHQAALRVCSASDPGPGGAAGGGEHGQQERPRAPSVLDVLSVHGTLPDALAVQTPAGYAVHLITGAAGGAVFSTNFVYGADTVGYGDRCRRGQREGAVRGHRRALGL
ncbi:hypothetical protein ACIQFZ_41895 [Streptomyces sp. NPDC093064]|uniref:hypothetical protein n=1 Tax=Streptomyces sp. NPDC093064 TaxID=3366020 RepID=UPI0037F66DD4